jgi:rubrerythrin
VSEPEPETSTPDPLLDEPEVDPEADPEADPDEADDEADDEAEPAEPDDAPSMQATLATLEKENTRHAKRFATILDVPLEALNHCPVCEGTGFTPEPVAALPELQKVGGWITCPTCAGRGAVEYPTFVENFRVQVCTDCAGSGYKADTPQAAPPAELGNGFPTGQPYDLPPGHVLVKVDPNAPDAATAATAHATSPPVYAP